MIILVRNNGIIHSSFLENELRIHEYSELKCRYMLRIFVAFHAMVASHRQSISGKWYVKLECASSVPSPGVGGVPGRFP